MAMVVIKIQKEDVEASEPLEIHIHEEYLHSFLPDNGKSNARHFLLTTAADGQLRDRPDWDEASLKSRLSISIPSLNIVYTLLSEDEDQLQCSQQHLKSLQPQPKLAQPQYPQSQSSQLQLQTLEPQPRSSQQHLKSLQPQPKPVQPQSSQLQLQTLEPQPRSSQQHLKSLQPQPKPVQSQSSQLQLQTLEPQPPSSQQHLKSLQPQPKPAQSHYSQSQSSQLQLHTLQPQSSLQHLQSLQPQSSHPEPHCSLTARQPSQNHNQLQTSGTDSGQQWKKRGFRWSHNATLRLIFLWKERKDRFANNIEKNEEIWEEISGAMQCDGYSDITGGQCENKFRYLKRIYTETKDTNQKSTGQPEKSCPYYEEMDEIFKKSPQFKPPRLVSSIDGAPMSTVSEDKENVNEPARKKTRLESNLTKWAESFQERSIEREQDRQRRHDEILQQNRNMHEQALQTYKDIMLKLLEKL